MDSRCVICGSEVPEGRMVCPMCESDSYPIFAELKNAVDYGYTTGWDSFRIITMIGGGYCVEPVYPTGYKPIDRLTLLNYADVICTEYCKYPDEYSSIYCDDPEEAVERCGIEKCENCPMTSWRNLSDGV